MDRRAFFTRGAGKVAEVVTEHAAEKARKKAEQWIRPPFAIDELDFLLACSRCHACIDACPVDVIFPLSARLGAQVVATPAMDLLNKGCLMCEGWPCVTACEPRALKLPALPQNADEESAGKLSAPNANGEQYKTRLAPKLATVIINKTTCLPYSGPECGACRVCPVEGAMLWRLEKPEINQAVCTGCALCREACIVEPKALLVESRYKKVVNDNV